MRVLVECVTQRFRSGQEVSRERLGIEAQQSDGRAGDGATCLGGNSTALARQFGAWQVEITEDDEIERWAHQTGALSAQRR